VLEEELVGKRETLVSTEIKLYARFYFTKARGMDCVYEQGK
jgi:hypothetical protein